MAMDSKQDFLRNVERSLSDSVTVSDMNTIMKTLANVMENYDMRMVTQWPDEKDDCLDSFLSALKVEGRSQKTIDRYSYIIGRMMKFIGISTRRITVYHLRSYLAAEKERGISDETLKGYRSIFLSYFNWLFRESLIERNPAANLGYIKCAIKEKKTYSAVEMEKLNSNAVKNRTGLRDRAIINFLSSTGCRISELTSLDMESVNLQDLECIVHGKGNKERVVYMDEVTGMLLGQYLESRKDNNPALFVGKGAKRLQPGGVRAMLKKVGEKAGVEKVHPHRFRRTFATECRHHGMPVEDIRALMGHDKIETTMGYINMNKDDIKNSYRRYA